MIRLLRRRHLQVWTLLAILLPAALLFSWLVIPNQQPVELLQSEQDDRLPVVERTIDKNNYAVYIRTDQQHANRQLEWVNKKTLEIPSAVIYLSGKKDFSPTEAQLVGRIEARGIYLFPLKLPATTSSHLHLILYDFIHEQVIDKIQL